MNIRAGRQTPPPTARMGPSSEEAPPRASPAALRPWQPQRKTFSEFCTCEQTESCCPANCSCVSVSPVPYQESEADGTSSPFKPAPHTETTGLPWTGGSSLVPPAVTTGRWPHGQNWWSWILSPKADVWEIGLLVKEFETR